MKLSADTKDLDKYFKTMNKVADEIPQITASTLNDQAFLHKNKYYPAALGDLFTIRSPKFIGRQTRVNTAKKNKSVANNFSEAGFIAADGFTGFEEQQEGRRPDKKRTATTDEGRGGDFKRKQKPSTRMKRGSFRKQSQYKGRSKKHRFFNMMRETQDKKLNFVISKGLGSIFNMTPGLYGWRGKKLRMLQSFKPPKIHKADINGKAFNLMKKNSGDFESLFFRKIGIIINQSGL